MRFLTRPSLTRWGGVLLFAALLLSAACTGPTDPLGATNTTPDFSHAAGEGYIGPADKAPPGMAHPPAEGGVASGVPEPAAPEAASGS